MDAMTEAHLLLPIEACEALCAGIQAAMVQGLSTGPGQESDLKMLPSFVTNFPKGGEQGSFIALDLGGTNLRVLHVELAPPGGGGVPKVRAKSFTVSEALMTGTGELP
ncbi:hypothetical protein T484DRAFT_1808900 [Baffinella frigidus]|nr:hypothetical protein T484DRAFT_1808900 [Cryptophyta sp. CCMP2293]